MKDYQILRKISSAVSVNLLEWILSKKQRGSVLHFLIRLSFWKTGVIGQNYWAGLKPGQHLTCWYYINKPVKIQTCVGPQCKTQTYIWYSITLSKRSLESGAGITILNTL